MNDPTKPWWAERQITREEAILIHDSKLWEDWTHRQRAEFQLTQRCLAMPFGVFHEAVEKALGRPVWTHEFGLNWAGLVRELRGDLPPPTMQEIIDLIPPEKLIVVERDAPEEDL
jgi:hypothetical protein